MTGRAGCRTIEACEAAARLRALPAGRDAR